MNKLELTARHFSLPDFLSMKGNKMSKLITDNHMVLSVVEGMGYIERVSTSVRDLGDDCVSLSVSRHYGDKVTREVVEDFGLDVFGNLFVSREHARAFALAILEELDGAGA